MITRFVLVLILLLPAYDFFFFFFFQAEDGIRDYKVTGVQTCALPIFLFVPLAIVFAEAFKKGIDVYLAAISESDALASIKLTLIAAGVAVPLNQIGRASCRERV